MSLLPTTTPSFLISEPLALSMERHLGDAGHDERVDEPAEHGEHDDGDDGRRQLAHEASHHFTPRALMMMSMSLMPMNGAMIPPTP